MIKIRDLTFSYGERKIFDNFSADFSDGITCIRGESGKGKTTLLRIISGLENNYSGEVSGVPERVSLMFQEDRLLPWMSAKENIALVDDGKCKLSPTRALELTELSDYAHKRPNSLSGGQQRRVSLARAVMYSPELLLLDEPFKGFDPELTARMANLIKSLNIPVIAIVHSDADAALLGGDTINLSDKPNY